MPGRLWVVVAVLLLGASFALPAHAKRRRREPVPTLGKSLRKSRSVGFPWRGSLDHSVRMRANDRVRFVPEYAAAGHHYGTWEIVQLLQRAAHRVNRRLPGPKLALGELSRRRGGDIAGHHSHESGRDVDIGFYMLDERGAPYEKGIAFAAFDHRGHGLSPNRNLRFDVARNWELIAKLVADGDARVQFIFVAPGLKRLLLAEGKRRGAPRVVLDRAAQVMARPSGRHPHNNHFHVRIYCGPRERPRCVDRAPYWPWYPGQPPSLNRPL